MDGLQWAKELSDKLRATFRDKVLFVGLQGSYGRGEATAESDIDMVAVLDHVGLEELKSYREVVSSMPNSSLACGFLCGLEELKIWPRYDLFCLVSDTLPLYGDLRPWIPPISKQDIAEGVRQGAANLYHELCHRFLYGNLTGKVEQLKAAYKAAFFLLRAAYYLGTNVYLPQKKELMEMLCEKDQEILRMSLNWDATKHQRESAPEACFVQLIDTCRRLMQAAYLPNSKA